MGGVLGREVEQQRLLALLADSRLGRAQAIALVGEPGIGKSSLLQWLGEQATGCTVLRAHGHEADTGSGYLILRQLLKPILSHLDALDDHLGSALRTALSLSTAMVNEAHVPLAALELLSAASEVAPLLLVMDDAHLFDGPSLDALAFVARRMVSEPMLLAFGVRPYAVAERTTFDNLQRLEVPRLDAAASRALAEQHGKLFTPEMHEACLGNPLALLHFEPGSESALSSQMPERLRRSFSDELATLPLATQQALALVAVAGSVPVDVRVTALRTFGLGEVNLLVATERGVLTDTGSFRHPMLRQAAVPDATAVAVIHDALADAYPAPNSTESLRHRLLGLGPWGAELIAAAAQQAEDLMAAGRADDARVLFVAAAHRDGDPASKSRLLLRAAHSHAFGGRYAASLPYFRQALSSAPEAVGRLPVVRSMVWAELWDGSTIEAGAARLTDALRATGPGDVTTSELTRAWGSLIALHVANDLHAALGVLAEVPDSIDLAGDAIVVRCYALDPSVLPTRQEFMDHMEAASGLSSAVFDSSASLYGELLLIEARWAVADEWAKRYLATLREEHFEADVGPGMARRIVARAFLGDCLTAYGLALTAVERDPDDGSVLGIGALAAAIVGADVARTWAQLTLDKGRRHGIGAFTIDGLHRMGLIALAADRIDEATGWLDATWTELTNRGFRHPGFAYARGDVAEAFARSGRTVDAQAVVSELEAGPFDLPWARGVAARTRGILGNAAQFSVAIDLLAESPWEVARTQLCWARALPSGSPERTELALLAARSFDTMGARPWALLANGLVASAGEPVGEASVDALVGLSDRERTVAFAVARGLSNKEVAGELFISLKTVDAHLQQIYRKLAIRSRTQLAALCHAGALIG
jgi:DNA-binding CsgD family transcriptional regulator/tetratricopeptide (TPR) repeat protein